MSTDRIRSGTSVVDLVRALSSSTRAGGTGKAGGKDGEQVAARDIATLRSRLGTVLQGVDPNDADATASARRPVLREILLWEFGADFREHPEFPRMLDKVESSLASDPRFAARFAKMVRQAQRR